MTKEQRERKMADAVRLSVRGRNYTEIAEEIGVTWNTSKKLVEDALAIRAEHRAVEAERERAIATYQAIIDEGWLRLETLKDSRSFNASALLNTIRAAQASIDDLTGAKAPKKYQHVGDTFEIVFDDEELDDDLSLAAER